MKGDFSRITFDPSNHYSAVLKQQGRVSLDSEENEDKAIREHLALTTTEDLVGPCGAPMSGGGFKIEVAGTSSQRDLSISAGRIYVDGILCELEGSGVTYGSQDDYPDPDPQLDAPVGQTDLVYLDVWQKHITVIEEPDLREVALNGPDTTTRVKTLWQVKVVSPVGNVTCVDDISGWPPSPSGGRLTTDVVTPPESTDPCSLSPSGGYRGLENRLYRVEVHQGGNIGNATFKWSEHNGSLLFAIQELISGGATAQLRLERVGRDRVLTLSQGDWVEVLDDATELSGASGTMAQISEIDEANGIVTLDRSLPAYDINGHPKVRRWSQPSDAITITNDTFDLDNSGIQVQFSGGNFLVGDWWVFAARSILGEIEPLSAAPPMGIEHHYCKLALVTWVASGDPWQATIQDCRPEFPALTELTSLYYVSGDGQEAMPSPLTPRLPYPLQAGVASGQWPLAGANVQFTAAPGNGNLEAQDGTDLGAQTVVQTGTDGVAEVYWRLNPDTDPGSVRPNQQVEAKLLNASQQEVLDASGNPVYLPVRFNANLSIASQVAYDNPAGCLTDAPTVKDALDQLCQNYTIHYVSGDGQPGLPGAFLAQPLVVRVSNGATPMDGADVAFTVRDGTGGLEEGTLPNFAPQAGPNDPLPDNIQVSTDQDGLAVCLWRLDSSTSSQRVEAHVARSQTLFVGFNASPNTADQVHFTPDPDCAGLATVNNVQDALNTLCKLSTPDDPGVHIEAVEIILPDTADRPPLLNDSEITPSTLANGILIRCDRDLAEDKERVDKPVCFVTLEMPYPLNQADLSFWGFDNLPLLIGYQPLKLASRVQIGDQFILWRPIDSSMRWLRQEFSKLFTTMRANEWDTRILAHLTVKSNFIWSQDDPSLYLDGQAFGVSVGDRTRLRLPSGDGKRGGDFEMWFWLTEQSRQPAGFGFIPGVKGPLVTNELLAEAFDIAINRSLLMEQGSLPRGYQVDANKELNLDRAQSLVAESGLQGLTLRMAVQPQFTDIASEIAQMMEQIGLQVAINEAPEEATMIAMMQSGEADFTIGDENLALRLSSQDPDTFGASSFNRL